jgi:hypothetical protein
MKIGAGGSAYRSTDDVRAAEAPARGAAEVLPAVRDAVAR